jgi:hypothetical protein
MNERINFESGYCAPILSADVARDALGERGSEVDILFFQADAPRMPDAEETLALVREFSPLCPNAKILVYGSFESRERFSSLERLVFVENPIILLPSALLAKVKELIEMK